MFLATTRSCCCPSTKTSTTLTPYFLRTFQIFIQITRSIAIITRIPIVILVDLPQSNIEFTFPTIVIHSIGISTWLSLDNTSTTCLIPFSKFRTPLICIDMFLFCATRTWWTSIQRTVSTASICWNKWDASENEEKGKERMHVECNDLTVCLCRVFICRLV